MLTEGRSIHVRGKKKFSSAAGLQGQGPRHHVVPVHAGPEVEARSVIRARTRRRRRCGMVVVACMLWGGRSGSGWEHGTNISKSDRRIYGYVLPCR